LTAGPLSGGGAQQLIVGGTLPGTGNGVVTVLQNDSTGGMSAFSVQATMATGGRGVSSVSLADFDGDGNREITGTNFLSNTVFVIDQPGGTFSAARTFATGSGPATAKVEDVDGDGDVDILFTQTGSAKASTFDGRRFGILRNEGDPESDGSAAFQPADISGVARLPDGTLANSLAVGELNGDGVPDVVVTVRSDPGFLFTSQNVLDGLNTINVRLNSLQPGSQRVDLFAGMKTVGGVSFGLSPVTEIDIDGSGNLTITDPSSGGIDDRLTLTTDGGDIVITDSSNSLKDLTGSTAVSVPSSAEVRIPLAQVTSGLVIVNTQAGNDLVEAQTLSGVMLSVSGGTGNDTLTGGLCPDTLEGGQGEDILAGGGGRDSLSGGDGNDNLNGGGSSGDSLRGGAGDDTINGGSGTDLLVEQNDADFTLTTNGNISQLTGNGTDIVIKVEQADISGGESSNVLDASAFTSSALSVTLRGGNGNDLLLGTTGPDGMFGDGGNDTLTAGDGNDDLYAGGGKDLVNGGMGDD
ncbi:MAG: FG-GAP-like repeat-containing protein, partial [Planctomycetaceae bacterium]